MARALALAREAMATGMMADAGSGRIISSVGTR